MGEIIISRPAGFTNLAGLFRFNSIGKVVSSQYFMVNLSERQNFTKLPKFSKVDYSNFLGAYEKFLKM